MSSDSAPKIGSDDDGFVVSIVVGSAMGIGTGIGPGMGIGMGTGWEEDIGTHSDRLLLSGLQW